MAALSTHYARLLGLGDFWRVDAVDLRLEERRVEIRLAHVVLSWFTVNWNPVGLA